MQIKYQKLIFLPKYDIISLCKNCISIHLHQLGGINMLWYSIILKLIIILMFILSIIKRSLTNKFFSSCDSFIFLSNQIFKLSEIDNFDFEKKVKIQSKVNCLEFENYWQAVRYIEYVSKELQIPVNASTAILDLRFEAYNKKLETVREEATLFLKNYIKKY